MGDRWQNIYFLKNNFPEHPAHNNYRFEQSLRSVILINTGVVHRKCYHVPVVCRNQCSTGSSSSTKNEKAELSIDRTPIYYGLTVMDEYFPN